MDNTGLIIAGFITVVFLIKFFLSITGFSLDVEDIDDFETDTNSFDLGMSDFLSLKGLLNFMFGFSWYWACFGLNNYHWIGAIVVGFTCLLILAYTYYLISKLEVTTENEPLNNLLGRMGSVYLVYTYTTEEDTTYKKFICQIKYNNKIESLDMFTKDNVMLNDTVKVTSIKGNVIYAEKVNV